MNALPFTTESHADRAAWLAARETPGRVSASQVADLLGIVPGGLWRAWCRMHEPHLLTGGETSATARGKAYEAGVLELWSRTTGRACVAWPQTDVAVSSRWPWLTCTPDATTDGEPVEAKTTRFGGWPDSGPLDLSTVEADPTSGQRTDLARFAFQCIAQAVVLGAPVTHLAVAGPFIDDLHIYTIEVTPRTVAAFIAAVQDARARIASEHPPIDDSALCEAWAKQPRIPSRGLTEGTPEQWAAAEAFAAAVADRKRAESAEKIARTTLADAMKDDAGIERDGRRVIWINLKNSRYPKASGFDAAQDEP